MQPMVWWIIIAVVFFILELATASFFYIWIGLGSLATVAVGYFFNPIWIQCAAFAAFSIFFVLISRPWRSKLSFASKRSANMDALVGCEGLVTKVDESQSFQGYIKVEGQYWKVETQDQQALKLNEKVSVVEAKGNILIVKI
jgi:membrane protein implicated in regulation of membrane protease activity